MKPGGKTGSGGCGGDGLDMGACGNLDFGEAAPEAELRAAMARARYDAQEDAFYSM